MKLYDTIIGYRTSNQEHASKKLKIAINKFYDECQENHEFQDLYYNSMDNVTYRVRRTLKIQMNKRKIDAEDNHVDTAGGIEFCGPSQCRTGMTKMLKTRTHHSGFWKKDACQGKVGVFIRYFWKEEEFLDEGGELRRWLGRWVGGEEKEGTG